jgi:protein-S-isoprenylcysteine O-methyltransferase Ste14
VSEASFDERVRAFVFKHRGTLLAIPAAALAIAGKPDVQSAAVGALPALLGELLRCWAVGYSGVTTRGDTVTAPRLVTAGPYAHLRNPLYLGNLITAAGFAVAFTGRNTPGVRAALIAGSLAAMAAVYAIIIPHEERYLRTQFGEAFDRYCARVPRMLPSLRPAPGGEGTWNPAVIREAESRTFLTFGAMALILALKILFAR